MNVIHSNPFATAAFDPETSIVYYEYVGIVNQKLGMETIRQVMDFATKNPIKGIVSDLSHMTGTFTGINGFFEKEYYPHMIKRGLVCTAIIVSKDIFTKFATNDLKKRAGNFELQMFENFRVGEKWVLNTVGSPITVGSSFNPYCL